MIEQAAVSGAYALGGEVPAFTAFFGCLLKEKNSNDEKSICSCRKIF